MAWPGTAAAGQTPSQPAYDVNKKSAFNTRYPYKGGLTWGDMKKQIGYGAQQSAMNGLNFMNQMQPQQQQMVSRAFAALNPQNRAGRVSNFRQQAMGAANDMVNQQGGTLLGGGEETYALLNAMRLGAQNNAQQAGNDFMAQQYSPEMDVQSALQASQMMDPSISSPLLNFYLSLIQEGDQAQIQKNAQKGGGMLGGLAGLAGMAGGLGWSPFK